MVKAVSLIALLSGLLLLVSPARAEVVVFFGQQEAQTLRSPVCWKARGREHCIVRKEAPVELHPLLQVAKRFLGRGKVTRKAGPWCRDFVNLVARQAGYHLANTSRRAIDAIRLGHRVSSPQAGDLIVMRHHVTIFAGWGGRGVLGLGGNQGHQVRVSSYPVSSVVAYVRL